MRNSFPHGAGRLAGAMPCWPSVTMRSAKGSLRGDESLFVIGWQTLAATDGMAMNRGALSDAAASLMRTGSPFSERP